jgi:hypothetical protein
MKKLSLLGLTLLCMTQIAVAAPMTSDVNLQDGFADPHKTLSISTAALVQGVQYDVQCHIFTVQKEGNFTPVDIKTNLYGPVSVNGVQVNSNIITLTENNVQATMLIHNVQSLSQPSLNFTDLDDTFGIAVTDCVASVHHQ